MGNVASFQRDLGALADQTFDVLVVGGGACGAATAREAALRGYRTALIERDDFSAGASAHCFKVVHGGIRYIQHADIKRMRASCFERAVLLRIAPHLVSPLPFVIPTYGHAKSSKWFLGTGMLLYDALTADINRHTLDPARHIRGTKFLSREATVALFPTVEPEGLTGAAVFEDGQMFSPPRLVLGFAAAAAELGASVANYVEAERLLVNDSRVTGVAARDCIGGQCFDIRARLVINAAGPWAEGLLEPLAQRYGPPGTYSRDACFMVPRRFAASMALAVQGRTRDSDALLARNSRHLFLVPWRDCTLVGVWHSIVPRRPDSIGLERAELRQFIDELNASYPALHLKESDVRRVDFGLVPFGEASRQHGGLSFGKESRVIDHREGGVSGLLSVISVRYTVARRDAVQALDLAVGQIGGSKTINESATRPLPGGDIEDFNRALHALTAQRPRWLPSGAIEALLRNYGTHAAQIFALAETEPRLGRCFSGSSITHAEALFAVRAEMAQRMSDVVLRRTGLGTNGHPGAQVLEEVQELLSREFGWSATRGAEERALLEQHFTRYLAPAPHAVAAAEPVDALR